MGSAAGKGVHNKRVEKYNADIPKGQSYTYEYEQQKADAYEHYFYFYDDEFSPWWTSTFYVEGVSFRSSGQYMTYKKAVLFRDKNIALRILNSTEPSEIRQLGRQVKNFDERTWKDNSVRIVREGHMEKFKRHEILLYKLFETRPRILVYANPDDDIWGIGLAANDVHAFDCDKWPGLNILGYILTSIRDGLLCESRFIRPNEIKFKMSAINSLYLHSEADVSHVTCACGKPEESNRKTETFQRFQAPNDVKQPDHMAIDKMKKTKNHKINDSKANAIFDSVGEENGIPMHSDSTIKTNDEKRNLDELTEVKQNQQAEQDSFGTQRSEHNTTKLKSIETTKSVHNDKDSVGATYNVNPKEHATSSQSGMTKHKQKHQTDNADSESKTQFNADDNFIKERETRVDITDTADHDLGNTVSRQYGDVSYSHDTAIKRIHEEQQKSHHNITHTFEMEVSSNHEGSNNGQPIKDVTDTTINTEWDSPRGHEKELILKATDEEMSTNRALRCGNDNAEGNIQIHETKPNDVLNTDKKNSDSQETLTRSKGNRATNTTLDRDGKPDFKTDPTENSRANDKTDLKHLHKEQTNDKPGLKRTQPGPLVNKQGRRLTGKDRYVYFWKAEDIYSQWYRSCFTINGQKFNCMEQYMMYRKAVLFKDDTMRDLIMETEDPQLMKIWGRHVKHLDEHVWRLNCIDIVKEGNRAKFLENEHLKKELFDTYPRILVEASPYDKIWGIGLLKSMPRAADEKTWDGLNLLGYIVTDVRDELMCEEELIDESEKHVYLTRIREAFINSAIKTNKSTGSEDNNTER